MDEEKGIKESEEIEIVYRSPLINLYHKDYYILYTVVVMAVATVCPALRLGDMVTGSQEFLIRFGWLLIGLSLMGFLSVRKTYKEEQIIKSKVSNPILALLADGVGRNAEQIEKELKISSKEKYNKSNIEKNLESFRDLGFIKQQKVTFIKEEQKKTSDFCWITDKGKCLLRKQQS